MNPHARHRGETYLGSGGLAGPRLSLGLEDLAAQVPALWRNLGVGCRLLERLMGCSGAKRDLYAAEACMLLRPGSQSLPFS
jgi:hypothetical protein